MQRMSFIGLLFVVLFVSLVGVSGCSHPADVAQRPTVSPADASPADASPADPSPTDASPDGHARMLALLARIRANANRDNEYIGNGKLRDLQATMAKSQRDGKIPEPRQRYDKGLLLRNLGRTDEALNEILHFHALLQGSGHPQAVNVGYQLAVTFMRAAENQNCVDNHTAESCLLPIRGSGVHVHKEYARQAMKYFKETLKILPDHYRSLWLLNVAAMVAGVYPEGVPAKYRIAPESFESQEPFPKFPNISMRVGLDTMSLCGGSIADDLDGDGLLDIVVSAYGPTDQLRIFMNSGDGTFRETTGQAGIVGIYGGLNLNQADYDNDGFPDFYLGTGYPNFDALMPNLMFHNLGGTGFSDVTTAGGFGQLQKGHGVAFADLDNEGDQDIFIEMGGAFLGDGYMNALFENPGFSNNWITVKLIGTASNRSAIGARIRCAISEGEKNETCTSG